MSSAKNRKRDDSYFAVKRRKQKRTMMIIIPIIAVFVAVGGVAGALYYANPPKVVDTSGFGPLGSEHEHGAFLVIIDGKQIDFNQGKYKVQSNYIHVEGNDGTTIHRHATDVPIKAFFDSVNMGVTDDGCFMTDDGKKYCDDGDKKLRFFLDGNETDATTLMNHVIQDGERFMINYGNESQEQIQQDLTRLKGLEIKG